MNTPIRYYHTVKDLKAVQILSRFKKYFFKPDFKKIETRDFSFQLPIPKSDFIEYSCIEDGEICFLNKRLPLTDFFKPGIFSSFLMLEQFTLHYMDFFLDPAFDRSTAKTFVEFYEKNTDLPCAFAPYVVSLRLVNWLKASHAHKFDQFTLSHLEKLGRFVKKYKEYDVLGNHLLKNIKALIFYQHYFQLSQEDVLSAQRLLEEQLNEQILPDGWHFERTPTYHLVVLEDLLDLYNILPASSSERMISILEDNITRMLGVTSIWQENYPLFNDSSYSSAPSLMDIHSYAEALGFEVRAQKTELRRFDNAGYYVYFKPGFTLWIDAGDLGPKYLPGHAHNDSLSFIMYVNDEILFTDTGACSYQELSLRNIARSVRSHNTVMIDDTEPSEFWRSFRYAKKVKFHSKDVADSRLRAAITYRNRKHERVWEINDESVNIVDTVDGKEGLAFFHLAEGHKVRLSNSDKTASIEKQGEEVAELKTENRFEVGESLYCPNINDTRKRKVLSVKFSHRNKVEIYTR